MKLIYFIKVSMFCFGFFLSGCESKTESRKPEFSAERSETESENGHPVVRVKTNESNELSDSEENELMRLAPNERLQKILLKEPTPEWLIRGASHQSSIVKSEQYDHSVHQISAPISLLGSKMLIEGGNSIDIALGDFKPNGVSRESKRGLVVLRRNIVSKVYQIKENNLLHRGDIPLPQFNFGENPRWYINRWEWIDNVTLIGSMLVDDVENGLISDARLYTYNIETKTLRSVDLPSGVVDPLDPNIKILHVQDGVVTISSVTGVFYLKLMD